MTQTKVDLTKSDQTVWLPQFFICGLLLIALLPGIPYTYFIFLRWASCSVFVYLARKAALNRKPSIWASVLGALAFLYNPVLPLHFPRELWTLINLASLGIAIRSIFTMRRDLPEINTQKHLWNDKDYMQAYMALTLTELPRKHQIFNIHPELKAVKSPYFEPITGDAEPPLAHLQVISKKRTQQWIRSATANRIRSYSSKFSAHRNKLLALLKWNDLAGALTFGFGEFLPQSISKDISRSDDLFHALLCELENRYVYWNKVGSTAAKALLKDLRQG